MGANAQSREVGFTVYNELFSHDDVHIVVGRKAD